MYSIASLFEVDSQGPWNVLSSLCEVSGVTTHSIPHFSWQTAETYQIDTVRKKLSYLTESIAPFHFTTSGLGVFINHRKIIFLIIVKTRLLLEIHQTLWDEVAKYGNDSRPYYAPESWIPHISLNLNELSEENFNCCFSKLLNENLQLEFQVNKFGLIYMNENKSGIDSLFPLRGINH